MTNLAYQLSKEAQFIKIEKSANVIVNAIIPSRQYFKPLNGQLNSYKWYKENVNI